MTDNVYDSTGAIFMGPEPFVFDRTAMLAGTAATFQTVASLGATHSPMLPADLDGPTPPPAGAPDSIVEFPSGTTMSTYHFHVDWTTPANTTFGLFQNVTIASFTQLCTTGRRCVPQSGVGTNSRLDGIGDRLMFRLAYRNFGDHEALVGNFTVSANSAAGIRWFELRGVTSGPETVFQQGTYAPNDGLWRWMGSIAQDGSGDMALGFSTSSATTFPSIAYTGRLVGDAAGQMPQGETQIVAGAGSQSGTGNRWGDYSAMAVDPVDDCTFWYTQEYYTTTATFSWQTRIASFKFPSCGPQVPDLTIAKSHTDPFNQSDTGKTYTITVTNSGSAATAGLVTVTDTLPTGLTLTGLTGTGWTCVVGTATCTRSTALGAGNSYPDITATVNVAVDSPAMVTNTVTVAGGGETNVANDSASDPTNVIATGLLRVTTSPALPSQISINGVPADSWGLTWVKLPPGSYTIHWSHIEGYTDPDDQVVSVTAGNTTTVTGTFTQRGSLRVITSPAVPGQISVDGVPRDDWGMWTDIPVGTHTVCFGAVAGFTAPACQNSVSVTAGNLTTVTGTYTASAGTGLTNVGFLRVTTSPALPSQISVNGNPMDSWALTWVELPAGSYTIHFSHIEGYTEPADQVVSMTVGNTTTVTGTFTQRGSLRVVTSPAVAGTISVDGIARDDWGMWTDIPTGSHTVHFGDVPGHTTPVDQMVTVTAGNTTTATGTYP
jgi:uncharacterized repeat protein (TIGR01451 family)